MANSGTPFQTQATVRGQQGIPGRVGSHLSVAQDEVGQDGEDGFARGALNAPDGEAAQAQPGIMGVARQAPTAATRRLVVELKAQGEDEGEDKLNKCFAIVNQLQVGGFILEIDGDGTVLP
jgi:hypothetical protein